MEVSHVQVIQRLCIRMIGTQVDQPIKSERKQKETVQIPRLNTKRTKNIRIPFEPSQKTFQVPEMGFKKLKNKLLYPSTKIFFMFLKK